VFGEGPDSQPHVLALLSALERRGGSDVRRLLEDEADGLRGSYGRILGLVPEEGARPSRLAEGWISRQAMGQRLREMQERGWVEVSPDPSDGRAVLVRLTSSGERMRRRTEAAVAELELEWARVVGEDRYRVFRSVLSELAAEPGG
jgi:DNA-binding MarR family transcriptional regulator